MDQSNIYQMTHPAPLVWPYLVTPKPEHTVGNTVYKSQYQGTFLLSTDHPDWAPLRAKLREMASNDLKKFFEEAAKEDPPRVYKPHVPVEDGTAVADAAKAKNKDREWARGKILFGAQSNVTKRNGDMLMPPRLVALLNGKYVNYGTSEAPRELASKFFYSGVLAIGTFMFSSYEGFSGGVTAYLNEVLSLNTGDRIAGGPDAEEKYGDPANFSSYTGHVSAVDPTVGLHGLV